MEGGSNCGVPVESGGGGGADLHVPGGGTGGGRQVPVHSGLLRTHINSPHRAHHRIIAFFFSPFAF